MNVSKYNQDNTTPSLIRKQLQQRKILTNQQPINDLQPFRSFRKAKDTQVDHMQPTNSPKVEAQKQGSTLKLKYEYPMYDSFQKANEKSPGKSKYQYDITGLKDENQLSVSHSIRQPLRYRSEIDQLSKVGQPMIKKNVKKLEVSYGFGTNSRRKQVQSIIFDSKVSKRSRPEGLDDKYVQSFSVSEELAVDPKLQNFQKKVNKVNQQIQAGLSNIQKMIQNLKKKKIEQSQIQFKIKANSRIQKLQRQFAERRAETLKQRQEEQIKLRQERQRRSPVMDLSPRKSELDKDLVKSVIENQINLQQKIQKAISPQKPKEEDVTQSLIQLQGNFKSQGITFPRQYTSFINRLAIQIQKDIDFTNKINELTKSNHIEAIRTLIFTQIQRQKSDVKVDKSFFTIQPMELDPLDQAKPSWYNKYNEQQLQQQALAVYRLYQNIETHFQTKLQHKYSQQVINLLFQELTKFNFTKDSHTDATCITVGHLLSYLNMRTNRSFRNRSLVKMLKRFNLKHNSFLNADAIARLIKF